MKLVLLFDLLRVLFFLCNIACPNFPGSRLHPSREPQDRENQCESFTPNNKKNFCSQIRVCDQNGHVPAATIKRQLFLWRVTIVCALRS
jgi:hypothetical protein